MRDCAIGPIWVAPDLKLQGSDLAELEALLTGGAGSVAGPLGRLTGEHPPASETVVLIALL